MRSRLARPTGICQTLIAALVAISFLAQGAGLRPAAGQVNQNTWTSPNYGCSLTWDDSWFVVEQSEEPGLDYLAITNGLSYAQVFAAADPATTPEAGLGSFLGGLRSSPQISDFMPHLDGNGNAIRGSDGSHAFAVFDYTVTFEDGSSGAFTNYIEVRLIVPGQSLVVLAVETQAEYFESERPAIEALITGLTSNPTPPSPEFGERAPVFASGQWRIAVSQVAISREFPDLGLKLKTDKEWLVVIVDVTNWSDQDAVLSAPDFTIQTDGAQKPVKIARKVMAPVAQSLGATLFADDLTLTVAAGETARVVLLFVVPADAGSNALTHDGNALPLDGVVEPAIDPADLSLPVTMPETVRGELASASDGQTIRVQLDGESGSTRMRLLGVNPPTRDSCFANEAEKVLDDLVGETVLIEEDAAITGGSIPSNYVWLVDRDGTRTLLNQQLIANGAAYAAQLPEDARFGAWFEASADAADLADIGLWAGCPTPTATPEAARPSPTPNASATPTPKPSATPGPKASPSPTPKPARPSPTQEPSPTATPDNIFTVRHVSRG
jgi:endonuclease YncB( thermonuclease family)